MTAATETPTRRAPVKAPKWTLRPTARKTLLTVHIIAAVALVGVVWSSVALNLYVLGSDDPELARSAYELMTVTVATGGIPLSLLSLATGIALGVTSRYGLVRHYWVFAKLVIQIVVIVIGATLFQPEAMVAALEDGDDIGGLQWRNIAAVSVQLALLLTATVLSVFKPKGRMRG